MNSTHSWKCYSVTIQATVSYQATVDGRGEEEAKEKAVDLFMRGEQSLVLDMDVVDIREIER
jgi:hypothetical protein